MTVEILKIKDLRKIYGVGETQVNALNGIDLTVKKRRVCGNCRFIGKWKNDIP